MRGISDAGGYIDGISGASVGAGQTLTVHASIADALIDAGYLDSHDIANYLVSIDGELRAKGERPDGSSWNVAIEQPDRFARTIVSTVALKDQAIATSGDYRHWQELDGRRVSHTMDSHTGQPVDNRLASVTVIAANVMAADAWATALLVDGEAAGLAMAEASGLHALFNVRHDDELFKLPIGKFA